MILELRRELVLEVARNMRAADRDEIFATRWDDDPNKVAADTMTASQGAVVATLTPPVAPVAVICAKALWPRVYGVGLYATERWPEVALQAWRWIKRELMPALLAAGAHRVECHSLAGHDAAHRFLRALGAAEQPVPRFGRDGQDFIRFWWTRERAEHVLLQQSGHAAAAAA